MQVSTKVLLGTMVGGTALFGFSRQASAGTLTLTLSANGSTTTVTDNDTNDTLTAPNQVGYSGSVGGFGTTVTVGTTNNPGSTGPAGATLNLTNTQIANLTGGPGTINIGLSDTDFTSPATGTQLDSALSASFVGAKRGNTVSFTSSADDNNTLFGTGVSAPPLALGGNAGAGISQNVALTGPYSLTSNLELTLQQGNVATVTGNTSVVIPEPASLALLGLGGLSLIARRRRRDNK